MRLLFIFFILPLIAVSQTVPVVDTATVTAFPGAWGVAAYITGGRGYPIYKVTNLNDTGAGSLRQAMLDASSNGGGNIVFEVAGTVLMPENGTSGSDDIEMTLTNVTFHGQTAPPPGITVTFGGATQWKPRNWSNVVMRYMRFRPLYRSDDVLSFGNFYGFIMDHCSVSWGGDECVSFTDRGGTYVSGKVTFQNNIISESKTGTLAGDSDAPGTFGGQFSFIRNLWYNIPWRVPNMNTYDRVDDINNLKHNWSDRIVYNQGAKTNHINNYHSSGTRSSIYSSGWYSANKVSSAGPAQIYTSGNIYDGVYNIGASDDQTLVWDEWTVVPPPIQYADPSVFVGTQFTYLGVAPPILDASAVYDTVRTNAGANRFLSDTHEVIKDWDFVDDEYMAVLAQGPGASEGYVSNSSTQSFPDTQRYADFHDVSYKNATPKASRPANWDTDNDGMPDSYEISTYGSIATQDETSDTDGDGYTDFEEYANLVDEGAASPPPAPTCSDGIQNGDETGIDCGGSCPPCDPDPDPEPGQGVQGKRIKKAKGYFIINQ